MSKDPRSYQLAATLLLIIWLLHIWAGISLVFFAAPGVGLFHLIRKKSGIPSLIPSVDVQFRLLITGVAAAVVYVTFFF